MGNDLIMRNFLFTFITFMAGYIWCYVLYVNPGWLIEEPKVDYTRVFVCTHYLPDDFTNCEIKRLTLE